MGKMGRNNRSGIREETQLSLHPYSPSLNPPPPHTPHILLSLARVPLEVHGLQLLHAPRAVLSIYGRTEHLLDMSFDVRFPHFRREGDFGQWEATLCEG